MPETPNKHMTPLTFGDAIAALKYGKRVARKGWNGKGMYLWLLPAAMVKAEWCREPHLKEVAEKDRTWEGKMEKFKACMTNEANKLSLDADCNTPDFVIGEFLASALGAYVSANGGEIEALGSIRMMTADKKVLTGWLASQTDMLAEDWEILD